MDGRLIEASYENIREYISNQDSLTNSVSSKLSHSFKLISISTFFFRKKYKNKMVEVACYNLSIYYLSTRQYSIRDIIINEITGLSFWK